MARHACGGSLGHIEPALAPGATFKGGARCASIRHATRAAAPWGIYSRRPHRAPPLKVKCAAAAAERGKDPPSPALGLVGCRNQGPRDTPASQVGAWPCEREPAFHLPVSMAWQLPHLQTASISHWTISRQGTRHKRQATPVLISALDVNAKSRKLVQAASTCDGAQHQCPGRDQAPTSRSPAVQARGGLVKRGPLRRPCVEQSTYPASRPAVRHSFPV